MTLTETRISAMQASAVQAMLRRAAKKPRNCVGCAISFGLFEVYEDRVGAEERDHDRQEIDEVAQIDDAARDRVEVIDKARLRHRDDQPFGSPALQQPEHDGRA